jgi:hypothetical protein
VGQGSGADYLYTYLRTYYRDETKATGWNNLAFPSVGMPHVLWELQGQQRAVFEEVDPHDHGHEGATVSRLRADQARAAERPEYNSPWPIWWPTCSGWASRPRPSACGWACGCCSSWRVHLIRLAPERRLLERRQVSRFGRAQPAANSSRSGATRRLRIFFSEPLFD